MTTDLDSQPTGNIAHDPAMVIPAECHSDDHIYQVSFDAVAWFEQASHDAIHALADCGWSGDYPADTVAVDCAEKNLSLQALFKYIELISTIASKKDEAGFECSVEKIPALRWLAQHRPEVICELKARWDEDSGYEISDLDQLPPPAPETTECFPAMEPLPSPTKVAFHVTEVTVTDPNTLAPVEVSIYKDCDSGGMFGVDNAFLITLSEDDPINEPFSGSEVRLIDGPFGELSPEVQPKQWRTLFVYVEQVVDTLTDAEDRENNIPGIYAVDVDISLPSHQAASAALDGFHSTVSIGMLDDFSFFVMCGDLKLVEDPDHEGYSLTSATGHVEKIGDIPSSRAA